MRRRLEDLFIVGVCSGLLIVPWLIRNVILTGYVSGGRKKLSEGFVEPTKSFARLLSKDLTASDIPYSFVSQYSVLLFVLMLAVGIGIALVWWVKRRHPESLHVPIGDRISGDIRKFFSDPESFLPIYVAVFIFMFIVLRSMWDFGIYIRMLVPLYVYILILGWIAFAYIVDTLESSKWRLARFAMYLLAILFLSQHAKHSWESYQKLKTGQMKSASASVERARKSPTIAWIKENLAPDDPIVTNYGREIYFFTGRTTLLPGYGSDWEAYGEFIERCSRLKIKYLVLFKSGYSFHFGPFMSLLKKRLDKGDLKEDIQLIAKFRDASIYQINGAVSGVP